MELAEPEVRDILLESSNDLRALACAQIAQKGDSAVLDADVRFDNAADRRDRAARDDQVVGFRHLPALPSNDPRAPATASNSSK